MTLMTLILVANVVFLLTSMFYLYKFIWPTLKMMQEILYKVDQAAIKAKLVADDLEASHLRAEGKTSKVPGEAADAAMQRPNGNNNHEV